VRSLTKERRELIEALVAEANIGDITASLLEKDEHLTAALEAIFELKFTHASLVFCGGSSLSKAHGIIERMSEDADIKVVLSKDTASWSKAQLRRYLGDEIRQNVVEAMEHCGFIEDVSLKLSLNDNRYIHTQWTYQRTYDGVTALRPNLQIELIVRSPSLTTETASIGTLADKLAGRQAPTLAVPVITVAETLAEKVLSFLRRASQLQISQMQRHWDETLIRHVYDVHCILLQEPQAQDASIAVFPSLTAGDTREFGYQDPIFSRDPRGALARALDQINSDSSQSRAEYNRVLLPLIYGDAKFSFDEAWLTFNQVARQLIDTLKPSFTHPAQH
jgi:predicted nucleotidyltransferase component of viral defense system